jgi:hypothetical protein
MYEEEDEDVQKNVIKIPPYRILHMDLDLPKKTEEPLSTLEKERQEANKKKEEEKKPVLERILECKLHIKF